MHKSITGAQIEAAATKMIYLPGFHSFFPQNITVCFPDINFLCTFVL